MLTQTQKEGLIAVADAVDKLRASGLVLIASSPNNWIIGYSTDGGAAPATGLDGEVLRELVRMVNTRSLN